ncbi:MAG TPA: hypothetical protein VK041_03885 [Opitutales bacterium]|nr:hypothetical protein [Opitutales bacterium]
MTLPDLFAPLIASFAITIFILFLARTVAHRSPQAASYLAESIAPGAGFLGGSLQVRGFPKFPPIDSTGWLWWMIVLILLLAPFRKRLPGFEKIFPPTALAILSFLLLKPFIGRSWNGFETVASIVGTFLIWFVGYFLIGRIRHAPRPSQPLFLLAIGTMALAILLTLSGTLSYGLYALALSDVIAASALWSIRPFLRTPLLDSGPAAIVIAIPWIGLLLGGYFFAQLPVVAAILAVFALTTFALPEIPKLRRLPAVPFFLLQLTWLLLPLLLAIFSTGKINSRF